MKVWQPAIISIHFGFVNCFNQNFGSLLTFQFIWSFGLQTLWLANDLWMVLIKSLTTFSEPVPIGLLAKCTIQSTSHQPDTSIEEPRRRCQIKVQFESGAKTKFQLALFQPITPISHHQVFLGPIAFRICITLIYVQNAANSRKMRI